MAWGVVEPKRCLLESKHRVSFRDNTEHQTLLHNKHVKQALLGVGTHYIMYKWSSWAISS